MEGWAVCDGCVVVDVSNLNAVAVDTTNMLTVAGVGTKLLEYDNATIAASSVMSPTGICPSVGLAGFVMGGGIGYVYRSTAMRRCR